MLRITECNNGKYKQSNWANNAGLPDVFVYDVVSVYADSDEAAMLLDILPVKLGQEVCVSGIYFYGDEAKFIVGNMTNFFKLGDTKDTEDDDAEDTNHYDDDEWDDDEWND